MPREDFFYITERGPLTYSVITEEAADRLGTKAYHLPVSALEKDDHRWFEKDHFLSFCGRFAGGEEHLHYHPSNLRKYAGASLAFSSFVSKLAVIASAGRTILRHTTGAAKSSEKLSGLGTSALSVKATKHGFDVTKDWREFLEYLDDTTTYPEEGYYNVLTKKLRIKGSIPSEGYLYYRERA
jgi:hypothetical protein